MTDAQFYGFTSLIAVLVAPYVAFLSFLVW